MSSNADQGANPFEASGNGNTEKDILPKSPERATSKFVLESPHRAAHRLDQHKYTFSAEQPASQFRQKSPEMNRPQPIIRAVATNSEQDKSLSPFHHKSKLKKVDY